MYCASCMDIYNAYTSTQFRNAMTHAPQIFSLTHKTHGARAETHTHTHTHTHTRTHAVILWHAHTEKGAIERSFTSSNCVSGVSQHLLPQGPPPRHPPGGLTLFVNALLQHEQLMVRLEKAGVTVSDFLNCSYSYCKKIKVNYCGSALHW
jgi:hypothetical protein